MQGEEILSHTFEEYVDMVKSFHGSAAPGVLLGGFMVHFASINYCLDVQYGVICETLKCLPDAVQILTPCTIGNKRLKVIDVGRFALTFYDRTDGNGIRVYLDQKKTEAWPELRSWYLKLKPKEQQDLQLLISQIREANITIFGKENILVDLKQIDREKKPVAICPLCNEASNNFIGELCIACKTECLPYVPSSPRKV